jgi:RNA polymerase sigma factor (sigma-70 family)
MTTMHLGTVLQQIARLFNEGNVAALGDERLLERFVAKRDEVAFAVLVERHGPMVFATCRAVLKDDHDAEDAFQATFLILARKAGSVRGQSALGGWLHRVAYRVALEADAAHTLRRRRERTAAERTTEVIHDPPYDDLRAALHAEIERLPERYRRAIVLCDLEGLTHGQAALQLNWSEGSVRGRLARAREMLRVRLTRRGWAPSGVMITAALAREGSASVAPALVSATVRAALTFAAGSAATGAISETASLWAQRVLRTWLWTRVNIAALAVALTGAMLWVAAGQVALGTAGKNLGEPPAPVASAPAPTSAKSAPADQSREVITFLGRVVDPQGKPVAGAKLYWTPGMGYLRQPYPSPERTTSGPDGRFKFEIEKAQFRDRSTVVVAAAAPNYGAGWVQIPPDGKRDDLTVSLVEDNEPVTGQILDLEGKPVPGATLRVMQINAAPTEDLAPFLDSVKGRKGVRLTLEHQYLPRHTIAFTPQVTTDAQGRFRLTGIGRNRLVLALLDGPGIASQYLHFMTCPEKTINVVEYEGMRGRDPRMLTTYYGSIFQHVAAPSKTIVGVVRDKDTRQPLEGVTILSNKVANNPFIGVEIVRTKTDAHGCYTLTGMPKGVGNRIIAEPDHNQPYPRSGMEVPDSPGLSPVTVDFELKRGIWIEGKITDKITGKPVPGSVEYLSMYTNPNLRDYPGFLGGFLTPFHLVKTKADGAYRVIGLPGPGVICVFRQVGYLVAPDRDDEYGVKEEHLNTAPYAITHPVNYGAVARIDPTAGVDSITRNVTLEPAWRFTVKVLGPDDEPLTGSLRFDMAGTASSWTNQGMKTAEFTESAFNPRRPYDLVFLHPKKNLVGVETPPKNPGETIVVRMRPGATVMGRLVDADGRPQPEVDLKVSFRLKAREALAGYSPDSIKTDNEGRFRIAGLLPGYEFQLRKGRETLSFGETLHAGQTSDLGNVQIKRSKD